MQNSKVSAIDGINGRDRDPTTTPGRDSALARARGTVKCCRNRSQVKSETAVKCVGFRTPSLRRHCPASAVIQAPPPPCRPGLPLTRSRLECALHRQGFPCCNHPPLPCVPPPLPRRSRSVRASPSSRPMAAFPVIQAGRPPRCPFRGLLGVHSRCGPHGR